MKRYKKLIIAIGITSAFAGFISLMWGKSVFNFARRLSPPEQSFKIGDPALAARFDELSKNGNSSCTVSFKDAIPTLPDTARLQGSCCSPMSPHRYSEQVEGLKQYRTIADIPPDPYDIDAGLAKKLLSYYDLKLTPAEQTAYDYAMEHADEKGPCCCKCWRWFVYGGLGKKLIREGGFTGEEITKVWNLSDGCGGDEEHHHNTS